MSETDLELLERYSREKAEDAFAEVVRRHLNLVYSSALRQVRSPQLAEEVAQATFVKLARKAAQLTPDTILSAWLYQVAYREGIDVVRREARRHWREQIATEINAMNASADDWQKLEPILEEAMNALDEQDRAAVLLRYFENKSLREVGSRLGTSDDAAQKRVSRAVERLREFLTKRGVGVSVGGLALLISENAIQSAPAGLTAVITTAAVTSTKLATLTAISKICAMTTLKKSVVAAALITAAGGGIYETHQSQQLRKQLHALTQEQARSGQVMEQLQRERDEATTRLAALEIELKQAQSGQNNAELLKLRGQVAGLKSTLNDPSEVEARELVARVKKLKQRLEQTPESKIPELDLLEEKDWLAAGRNWQLNSEADFRKALSGLRYVAEQKFAKKVQPALAKYLKANENLFPINLTQMQPYFDASVNGAMLQRWQILPPGAKAPGLGTPGPLIMQKEVVDPLLDQRLVIPQTGGCLSTDFLGTELSDTLVPVYLAFDVATKNDGFDRGEPSQLMPYATTPEQRAAVQKLIEQFELRK